MSLTLFGHKIRQLRQSKPEKLADTAKALGVSSAYLSALENGQKSKPSARLLHLICQHFNIIWDDADALLKLADLSEPKPKIDLSQASPTFQVFVNLLASQSEQIDDETLRRWIDTFELEPQVQKEINAFLSQIG